MKPQLVEYDKIFQKKVKINDPQIKRSKEIVYQVDNSNFFFNIIGLIIIIVFIIILYYRKKNKKENEKMYTQKVIQLYHDINK
jgi:LPXTG-motif cell wall-anchored protein